jgi:hypothetical protein
MRLKRFLLLQGWALALVCLSLLIQFGTSAAPAAAQAPSQLTAVLADLSARVGRPVTVENLQNWRYTQEVFPDASLGCPQAGQTYAQVPTRGYTFVIDYADTTYDYRTNDAATVIVLCSSVSRAPTTCPPASPVPYTPTRLTVGAQARVTPNNFVSLRDGPARGSTSLGDIAAGAVLDVLEGPRCAVGSLNYWRVRYNSPNGVLTGWVAEGYNGEYYLEPTTPVTAVAPAATATPIAADAAAASLTARLSAANAANLSDLVSVASVDGLVAIAPDGARLAAVAADNSIVVADILTSSVSVQIPPINGDTKVTHLVFSDDGALLAVAAGNQVRVLRVADGAQFAQYQIDAGVTAVAFSPLREDETYTAGLLLAVGTAGGTLFVWDGAQPNGLPLVNGVGLHTSAIISLTFNRAGTVLVTRAADNTARIMGVR